MADPTQGQQVLSKIISTYPPGGYGNAPISLQTINDALKYFTGDQVYSLYQQGQNGGNSNGRQAIVDAITSRSASDAATAAATSVETAKKNDTYAIYGGAPDNTSNSSSGQGVQGTNNQQASTGGNASVLAQQINHITGWSYDESVALAQGIVSGDAGAIQVGIRLGILPNVNTSGGGSSGPAPESQNSLAAAAAQNILNNFNPTTDLIKIPGTNKYVIRGTTTTVDMSDPSQYNPILDNGQPTGFYVNGAGQTINAQGNKIAADQVAETLRHDKVSESQSQQTIDAQTTRDAQAAKQAAINEINAQNANIAALTANPGKFIQREYTLAGMARPSGVNEPGYYTGPGITSAADANIAGDTAKGNVMAAAWNSKYANNQANTSPVGVMPGIVSGATAAKPVVPYNAPPLVPGSPAWVAQQEAAHYTQGPNTSSTTPNTNTGQVPSWAINPAAPWNPNTTLTPVATKPAQTTLGGSGLVSNPTANQTNPVTFQDVQYNGDDSSGYNVSQGDFDSLMASLPDDTPVYNFATGGMTTDTKLIAGDPQQQQQGLPGNNPELISNPTGAPLGIQPLNGVTDPSQQPSPPQGLVSGMGTPQGQPQPQDNTQQTPKPPPSKVVQISKILTMVDKVIGDDTVSHEIGSILLDELAKTSGKKTPASITPHGRLLSGSMGPPKFAYGTGSRVDDNGFVSNKPPDGLITPGNISMDNRPQVNNPDGSISTVRSISIEQDGKTYLIPTVVNGKVVSNEEAIQHFRATGEHMGVFRDNQSADNEAEKIHEIEASKIPKYAYGTTGSIDTNPQTNDYTGSDLGIIPGLGQSQTPQEDINQLPSISYLTGGGPQQSPTSRNTTGAGGVQIPEFNNINYGRYLDIRQDPMTYGLLSSLYSSASRDLDGEAARAKMFAPIGGASRLVRT